MVFWMVITIIKLLYIKALFSFVKHLLNTYVLTIDTHWTILLHVQFCLFAKIPSQPFETSPNYRKTHCHSINVVTE